MKKGFILLIFVVVTGCGQSGKLYLPQPTEIQPTHVETSHGRDAAI